MAPQKRRIQFFLASFLVSELEAIPDMTMKSHKMDIIFCGICRMLGWSWIIHPGLGVLMEDVVHIIPEYNHWFDWTWLNFLSWRKQNSCHGTIVSAMGNTAFDHAREASTSSPIRFMTQNCTFDFTPRSFDFSQNHKVLRFTTRNCPFDLRSPFGI